jgi:hypothetical protein
MCSLLSIFEIAGRCGEEGVRERSLRRPFYIGECYMLDKTTKPAVPPWLEKSGKIEVMLHNLHTFRSTHKLTVMSISESGEHTINVIPRGF